jgi:hypothetical protein
MEADLIRLIVTNLPNFAFALVCVWILVRALERMDSERTRLTERVLDYFIGGTKPTAVNGNVKPSPPLPAIDGSHQPPTAA